MLATINDCMQHFTICDTHNEAAGLQVPARASENMVDWEGRGKPASLKSTPRNSILRI